VARTTFVSPESASPINEDEAIELAGRLKNVRPELAAVILKGGRIKLTADDWANVSVALGLILQQHDSEDRWPGLAALRRTIAGREFDAG
jgi:hypothetical protein